MSTNAEFGKWRSRLWPIYGYELKKIIPMAFILYLTLFIYTILRDIKDTLVVTCSDAGAEIIPFLKIWGTVPFAIIFTIVYSKLCNIYGTGRLFYLVITFFMAFFCLFSLFLYPNKGTLHPTVFPDYLESVLPQGLKGLVAVLRNWTFSLFYVFSQLWGSVCLSLLFWGYANRITAIADSKRFYAFFGLMGNLSVPMAGLFVYYASQRQESLPVGGDPWSHSLNMMTCMVVLAGLLMMAIHWWINHDMNQKAQVGEPDGAKKENDRLSLPLKESLLHIINSPYMRCLAMTVISYGVCINIIEVTWKGQLRLQFPEPNEYSQFMGLFSSCTGLLSIFMALFVTNNVIRRFGWTAAALCTPMMLLVSGLLFFFFLLFRETLPASFFLSIGVTPLMVTVLLGALQNMVSKATKYSLFDPTKEMSYIPLDREQKVKGKAAIDVVCNPVGKSAGSILQQGLILMLGSLAAIAPYVSIIVLLFFIVWIISVQALGRQFNALAHSKDKSGSHN